MKSGFWQVQINKTDKYKTAFTTPFGHYEWNVMPFGLKNAPSEFQNIMNDIFNSFGHFTIVYIDDVLVYSKSIDKHWKHLYSFLDTIKCNGLVVSAKKIKLFQTNVHFLGYDISKGQIRLIDRAIQFADKFSDVIIDKIQLQIFLGSLNYIVDFYKDLENYVNLYLIDYKIIVLLGLIFIFLLSNKSSPMLKLCLVLVFLPSMLSKLLKLMPLTLVMEVY